MSLFIGNTAPSKIFVGDTPVSKVFVGDVQVFPTGWQPGANTVAYYPFEENINDASGNNRNLTMHTGTFTYETLSSGKKVCRFNTSAIAKITSIPFNRTAYTVSAWCSWNTISSTYQKIIVDIVDLKDHRPRYFAYGTEVTGLLSSESDGVSYVQNKWYHIVVTYDNGEIKMYIDNTLMVTYTVSETVTTAKMLINGADAGNYNVNYRTAGTISELILESQVWSAQEISDYYNQTKSNYGISNLQSIQNNLSNITPTITPSITPNINLNDLNTNSSGSGNIQSI